MAYSDDRKLMLRTKRAARALGIAATWVNSGQPVNISTDFIYELYILFELILQLSRFYKIKYNPGVGKNQHCFPKKPANKAGRPNFEVYSRHTRSLIWQICAGTKIVDKVNMKRAPDISFQKGSASDLPTFDDVELIWDAKYKSDSNTRITHKEISEFARWIDTLELRMTVIANLQLSQFHRMTANCLITNGKESTEPNAERIRCNLKEVMKFFPDKQFRVFP